jgi:Tfp pilus assembly protein FimT
MRLARSRAVKKSRANAVKKSRANKALCSSMVDDPMYLAKLKKRLRDGADKSLAQLVAEALGVLKPAFTIEQMRKSNCATVTTSSHAGPPRSEGRRGGASQRGKNDETSTEHSSVGRWVDVRIGQRSELARLGS